MPRLPPVPISPQMRLRARFWPGVIDSVATFFQSHSSSSATSWARPVSVPCPISERAMRITQVSSGLTTTQAWASVPALPTPWPSPDPTPDGSRIPMARLPAAAAVPTMKLRRERFKILALVAFMSRPPTGRHVHRRPDALIGSAAADVRHRVVDVRVGRFRVSLQPGRRGHDLPGLAVTALRHVDRRPGLLHGMRAGGRQPFDGDDLIGGLHAPDRHSAGAHQRAVDVHGTGSALRDATTILGARQAHLLADGPQQRRVGLHLHLTDPAIDVELSHEPLPRLAVMATLFATLRSSTARLNSPCSAMLTPSRPSALVSLLQSSSSSAGSSISDEGQRLDVGLTARQPRQVEGGGVHGGSAAGHEHLRPELAGDRAVHEAVAAEAGDDVKSCDAGDRADDSRLVRRHLIEAGPGAHELGVRQRRRPVNRPLDHPWLEAPIDLGAEAIGLVATAVTEQH